MINYKEIIAKKISNITNLSKEELLEYIEIPPNSDLGDYAFPCFRLAKSLKKSPQVIAQELKDKIELGEEITKIDIAGGYLNFFVNKTALVIDVINEIYNQKGKYGSSNIGEGKNVPIDYSAPNIAKPFHIGHLRSTVIGGALYKIYEFLGYNPIGINYIGDWGLQFGKVMAGYSLWKDEYDFINDKPINSILQIYIRYNKEANENEELMDLARKWFLKLEEKDEEAVKLWTWIKDISLKEYNKIYDLINCKFDSYNGESFYNDKMDRIVKMLEDKGLLVESEGAKVVDLSEYDMPPCIIITSAGTTIYATRDLASLLYRIENYDFDKAIYVVGNEQQLHFKQVFKVLELMGYGKYAKSCVHIPFGLVVDKNGEKIGSRKGNGTSLEEIFDEAINKVEKIIEQKNPNLENKKEVARIVGTGAIIFNDLANNRIKDEIFDWDEILNFNGETGPYIQYIYVRTQSIIRKAGYLPDIKDIDFSLLNEKQTIEIIKILSRFNETVINAANKYEPSIISRYLIDLAKSFSSFYNDYHIICDDKKLQDARIMITYSVATVIKTGLKLLGIDCPEQM